MRQEWILLQWLSSVLGKRLAKSVMLLTELRNNGSEVVKRWHTDYLIFLSYSHDFLWPWGRLCFNTLWKKEKMLVTSIFSFIQNNFCRMIDRFHILRYSLKFVYICPLWTSQSFSCITTKISELYITCNYNESSCRRNGSICHLKWLKS